MSTHSKVIAPTDTQTDTDRHTNRDSDRHTDMMKNITSTTYIRGTWWVG